jgi:hypothetical protein
VHRFQGQSAGPVDEGKIPNSCEVIIADPDTSKAENNALGLFYTILSRATTLGNDDGTGSALYFSGPTLTEERVTFLGQKKNSRDFCIPFLQRAEWSDHLKKGIDKMKFRKRHQLAMIRWCLTTRFTERHLTNLILKRAKN